MIFQFEKKNLSSPSLTGLSRRKQLIIRSSIGFQSSLLTFSLKELLIMKCRFDIYVSFLKCTNLKISQECLLSLNCDVKMNRNFHYSLWHIGMFSRIARLLDLRTILKLLTFQRQKKKYQPFIKFKQKRNHFFVLRDHSKGRRIFPCSFVDFSKREWWTGIRK